MLRRLPCISASGVYVYAYAPRPLDGHGPGAFAPTILDMSCETKH